MVWSPPKEEDFKRWASEHKEHYGDLETPTNHVTMAEWRECRDQEFFDLD